MFSIAATESEESSSINCPTIEIDRNLVVNVYFLYHRFWRSEKGRTGALKAITIGSTVIKMNSINQTVVSPIPLKGMPNIDHVPYLFTSIIAEIRFSGSKIHKILDMYTSGVGMAPL